MTASARPIQEPPARTGEGSRFWLVVATLVTAEMTSAMSTSMISVALAHLYGLYGDPVRVTWLITIYGLTSAATAAICSRLGDLYGRRRMLIIMLLVAAAGSLISAYGRDLNVVIAGRALQGCAMAVLPLAFGILRETARDKRQLDVGVGILGGTYSFSTGVSVVLGGVIIDRANWQDIFLVSAVVAMIALVMAWKILAKDRPRPAQGPLDLVGGIGVVFPIAALLLGLNNIKLQGWGAPLTLSLFAGGVVGLVAWTLYELRQKNPMIDVRLLKVPQIVIVNLVICFTSMGPLIYPQVLMPLLQQPVWTGVGMGITATMAGLIKLPTNVTSGATAIASGYLAQRYTFRPIIILATGATFFAWVLLTLEHNSIWLLVAAAVLVLAPAGTILFGCAPSLIIEATPEDRTSEATGLSSVLRALAMAVGSQVIAVTLSTSLVSNGAGAKFPDQKAYFATFAVVTGFALASFLFSLLIPRPRAALQLEPAPAT